MKFIIDADVPRSFFFKLKEKGFDIIDARDISKQPLKDEEIYQLACDQQRILITRDLDFSNILLYPPQRSSGIIILRTYLLSPAEMFKIVENLLIKVTEQQLLKTLVIAQPNRFRFFR